MNRTIHNRFDSKKIPSDVTVHAGGTSFSLHKVPLVSKCGYIRKLVSECGDAADIQIPDIPGGAEAFELAAKFCYGINFEIGTENIVMLRCVAEYLEMTEDYAVGNLVEGCEAYLKEMVLKSLPGSVLLLQMSVDLLPMAEKVNIVNRCVDAIACIACRESQSHFCLSESGTDEAVAQWWAEDLTGLRIEHFRRVMVAMKARGFKELALGPVLMLYAQKSLRGLEMYGKGMRKRIEARQENEHEHEHEHEKIVVVETITSLLPRERHAIPASFHSMLLRSAIYMETTVACRLDLEKRMALQLGQAALDDLLIPSYGHTLFDVDTVHRIMANYLTYADPTTDDDTERVGKLMQSYLAEIAPDLNLSVSKFSTLADLIPRRSTTTDDAMYRAIHIYLKAHPDLNDMERKKVCSLMDCEKLSREARDHAARNGTLPVRTVVQVLYYELQRLRHHVMTDNNNNVVGNKESRVPRTTDLNLYSDDVHTAPDHEVSLLQREKEKLKMELMNVNMKLKEIERSGMVNSGGSSPQIRSSIIASADKPSFRRKTFINLVSKKLAKLSPFVRSGSGASARTKPLKHRRHSIS